MKAQPVKPKTVKTVKPKVTKSVKNGAKNTKAKKVIKTTAIAAPVKAQPVLATKPRLKLPSAWLTARRLGAAVVVILLLVGAFALVRATSDGKLLEPAANNDGVNGQYLSQVDTETGAPRSGRDPATQQQTSLADAASRPTGASTSGDITSGTTTSGAQDDHDGHSEPSDVIADPKQTGILVNGCYADYGKPGEECVPAHAATNGKLTCSGIRTHAGFPNGVKVTGTDRFNLDTNGDKIACNSGDKS